MRSSCGPREEQHICWWRYTITQSPGAHSRPGGARARGRPRRPRVHHAAHAHKYALMQKRTHMHRCMCAHGCAGRHAHTHTHKQGFGARTDTHSLTDKHESTENIRPDGGTLFQIDVDPGDVSRTLNLRLKLKLLAYCFGPIVLNGENQHTIKLTMHTSD